MRYIAVILFLLSLCFFIYSWFYLNKINYDSNVISEKIELPEKPVDDLKDVSSLLIRGNRFLESGFLSLAINDFYNATKIEKDNKNIWIKLINAQMLLGDFSSAENSINLAVDIFPSDEDFKILLGKIKIKKSDIASASNIFNSLVDGYDKIYYLSVLNLYNKEYKQAEEGFRKLINSDFYKSESIKVINVFDEFNLFTEGHPLHLDLMIAKVLNDLKFYELSIPVVKDILEKREDYRDAWIILGHNYLILGKYTLAKNMLQKAFEIDPTKPETLFYLGLTEGYIGEYDTAIDHILMARENKYSPSVYLTKSLADIYMKSGYYNEARIEYEKIIEEKGNNIEDFIKPVEIAIEKNKDYETAKILSKRAVDLHPDSLIAKNLLSWSLISNNELEYAESLLLPFVSNNDSFSSLNLGRLYEKKGNLKLSLDFYKRSYDLDPHSKIGAIASENYNKLVMKSR